MNHTRTAPSTARAAAAVALSAALALTVTACGSDPRTTTTAKPAASGVTQPAAATSAPATQSAGPALATIKGPQGIVITLTSARRQAGGFVTVQGTVQNTGSDPYTGAGSWRGDEEALQKNGGSLAGATLVDLSGKKRYYVLRDTDGDCLCTTGLDIIQPGASLPVYAQFPAPPATTTQVDFDLPTLPIATIAISQ